MQMINVKHIFTSLLSLVSLFSFGQSKILLNNATLELDNNVLEFQASSSEAYHGNVYRIIEFDQIPDDKTVQALKSTQIELLDYLPHNAYVAALPFNISPRTLESQGIRAVVIPPAELKLSPSFYNGVIPDHAARENDRVEIVLMPYTNVNSSDLLRSLKIEGLEVIEIGSIGNFIEATCFISDIPELIKHPWVAHVFEADVPDEHDNNTAITSHRVNTINGMNAPGVSYTGQGVIVSLGDDGAIGPHIDYEGRLDQSAAGPSQGDHGDHVAGTIFGAGNRNPLGRGMAPGADILYYSYPGNLNNVTADYNNTGIRITSSSYSNGCNAGYNNFARNMDLTSRNLPGLMHVFSAGNSGTSNCGYGAGAGWGNITGGHKIGKNVIAVGNVTRLDVIANSSSRGPAHDGRLKPEVCAVGTQVFSTTDPHQYTTKTGTSMACPGVSGALAVMYEAYEDITTNAPNGGLMKAILMNGADDLGNPGPDYTYGFGRINMRKSLRMIENNWIFSGSVGQGGSSSHTITVPAGVSQLRVMVYWTDREANVNTAKALVNNLDMTMTQGANTFQPLILNPTPNAALLNANAVPGTDTLNNVEQIVVNNPSAGSYTVNIQGTAVPFGPQPYHVVYYFEDEPLVLTYPTGGESFVPGQNEIIRWDATGIVGNFTLQISQNNGSTWSNIATSINGATRHLTWTVPPGIVNDQIKFRISRGTLSSESDNLVIAGVPANVSFVSICPDTTTITWSPVANATGYVVYKLGPMYMDSVGYTTSTTFSIPNVSAFDPNWYSVSAVASNMGIGRRAVAIESAGNGLFNCVVNNDIAAAKLISPSTGLIPSCAADSIPVSLWVKNNGINSISDFSLNFRINAGPTTSETITQAIASGDSVLITGSHYINPISGVLNDIEIWVNIPNDQSARNDSAYASIELYGTTGAFSLPYVMNFENETTCPTVADCEGTVCPLGNGYVNAQNNVFDDIDWRVNSGTTPSQNTGPLVDNTLGTAAGKYVYLEATTCFDKTAQLYTGCVDLTSASAPILEFFHHRRGNSVGPLNVEVYSNGEWISVHTPITGSTGNNWVRYEANLVPFIGQKIAVRFLGETIGSWQGDIALDDISIKETPDIPVADFMAIDSVTCISANVILEDQSIGAANTWNWSITPANFTLAPGSSLSDQNPIVQFTANGLYTITLIASNNNGADTLTKVNHVQVSDGDPIPYLGVYAMGGVPSPTLAGWTLDNPDNDDTWEFVPNLTNPVSNAAVRVNNFSYNAPGERDHLISPAFDLTGASNAYLIFDYAYAPFNNAFNDSLQIDAAVGCDAGFDTTLFYSGGVDLRTIAGFRNTLFVPTASEWDSDTIDISGLVGNTVRFRFTNINGFGNALYINNFRITDSLVAAPTVSISSNASSSCVNGTVVFSQTGSGATNYSWNFGNGASPSSATGPGPHSVVYLSTGPKNISLTASNAGGQVVDNISLTVSDRPFAAFNESINNLTVNFTDISIGNPTSWVWAFGDGDSAFVANPTHTYAQSGTYTVSLKAFNDCGFREFTRQVTVTNVSVEEFTRGNWKLYPNPGKGRAQLETPEDAKIHRVQIINANGQILHDEFVNENPSEIEFGNFAGGVYLIRLYLENEVQTLRYTLIQP
jgi:PKD repeat protein